MKRYLFDTYIFRVTRLWYTDGMNGGRPKQGISAGFTIVETLIVMAVTGVLFVSVFVTMSERQHKTEFIQATNDVQSSIQQVINEVSTGYYPSDNNFTCTKDPSTGLTVISDASSAAQGTNNDCVFLGKAMQFGETGATAQQYNTFSIAGLRSGTTLSSTNPTVIRNGTVDTTISKPLRYGLTVLSMSYNNGGGDVPIGAVAFISTLGSIDAAGNYASGNQSFNLVPITGLPAFTVPASTMANAIDTRLGMMSSVVNPINGVKICFQGGANQTALVTIGSNGHDLLVKMEIKTCA